MAPGAAGRGRCARHAHHPRRDRPRHHLHRQLLGLQRRRERAAHGQGAARRLPRKRLPDDQDRRPSRAGGDAPARRVAAPAADRPPRSRAAPRGAFATTIRIASSTRTARNEALLEARRAGKVRYIGFTGHKDPHIHLHMLDVAREHGFTFDTVQMPLNVMDAHYRSFERLVLPRLVAERHRRARDEAAWRNGIILKSDTATARECLRYALNLPTLGGDHRHRLARDARPGARGCRHVHRR